MAKVLFHDALVVLEGAPTRYDVTVCTYLSPNRYHVAGNLYARDGSPLPSNPAATRIERIYGRPDAAQAGFIDIAEPYGDTAKPRRPDISMWTNRPPERSFSNRIRAGSCR